MSKTETLKTRWRPEFNSLPTASTVRKALHQVCESVEMLGGKRTTIATDPRLSEAAKAEDLRSYAASEARTVAKAQRAYSKAVEKLTERKLAMTPSVGDKTNIAAALLRGELRALMRTKSPGDQARILFDRYADPTLLEAVFEAPCELSGIDPDMRGKVLDAIVERHPGSATLGLEGEALAVLDAAIRMAEGDLQSAAQLTPHQFESWFEEATKQTPADAAKEATALEAQHVAEAAKKLPFHQRHSLVESLLQTNSDELAGTAKATRSQPKETMC